MARIFTSGFELRSDSTGNRSESVEFWSNYRNSTNSVSLINTTTYNTGGAGTASLRSYATTAVTAGKSLWAGLDTSPTACYCSFYFRVDAWPSASETVFGAIISDNTSYYSPCNFLLSSTGVLRMGSNDTSSYSYVQVGSTKQLSLNTWYHIEAYGKFIDATHTDAEWKVNGVSQGSLLNQVTSGSTATTFGGIELGLSLDDVTPINTSGDFYFDDVILNDTTGSYENSWPGEQFVIAMRPDAAGSVNTMLKTNLSTAGDTSNYQLVDETTPNDATDFVGSKTQNQEDFYTTSNSGLASSDTIKCVAIGYRHKGSGTGGGSFMGCKLQAKIGSGGTVKQGAEIAATSNSEWKTNSNTPASYSSTNLYRPYPIYMYLEPDNTTSWTTTDLDNLHIGIKATAASSAKFGTASAIWAMVSYSKPSTTIAGIGGYGISMMGAGAL